jgi:hypothetical protein
MLAGAEVVGRFSETASKKRTGSPNELSGHSYDDSK